MQVKVSAKYQVVIPKEVRKRMQIKPGQRVNVELGDNKIITIATESVVEKYAGSLTGVWGGEDPAKWLRTERDAWDRGPHSDRRR